MASSVVVEALRQAILFVVSERGQIECE